MAILNRAVLKITGDPDGSGTKTAEFNLVGDLQIVLGIRTGFVVGGRGSSINSITTGDDRAGLYVDLGGGQHYAEADFKGWSGATDSSGNQLQWGASGKGGTKYDATGEDAFVQLNVLDWWLTNVKIDSRNPATLEVGSYSTDGRYDPLDVVIEQPQGTIKAKSSDQFNGNMRFIEAAHVDTKIDASTRKEK